jgi:hypothetical protein
MRSTTPTPHAEPPPSSSSTASAEESVRRMRDAEDGASRDSAASLKRALEKSK